MNGAFAGQALAGTWTLTIADVAASDTGTLSQWCLLPSTETAVTYKVGGSVDGLLGNSVTLSLNAGAQTVLVSSNGPFEFPNSLASGAN